MQTHFSVYRTFALLRSQHRTRCQSHKSSSSSSKLVGRTVIMSWAT